MLNGKSFSPLAFSSQLKVELEEQNVESLLRTRTSTPAIGRVIKVWWNREQMDGHSIECAALVCKNPFPRQYVFSPADDPPSLPPPPRVSGGSKQKKNPSLNSKAKTAGIQFHSIRISMADDEYLRVNPTLSVPPSLRMRRRQRNAHHISGVKPRAAPDRASLYDGRKRKHAGCILPRNANINTARSCG